MSYILDALNKADRARKQQQPKQATAPLPAPQPKANQSWLWGGLALLGIIIVVTLWWFNQEQANIRGLFTSQTIKSETIKPAIPQPDTITTKPHTAVTSTPMPTYTTHRTTTVTQHPQAIPHISDLDAAIQNQLPAISMTAHVYSANTQKRMVIINNRMLHEGDTIADGLTLKSIDHQGVTLSLDDTLFTMKTKDTWPPR